MFASDIHGSLPATERVLERVRAKRRALAGDIRRCHGFTQTRNALPEGYAPAGRRTPERRGGGANHYAVRGSCDSEVDQMLLHFPITAPWQQILTQERRLF